MDPFVVCQALESSSAMAQHICNINGFYILGRVLGISQNGKMLFATFDLCPLFMAQVIPPSAALCFHYKIELFLTVIFYQHRPVRVIGSERGRDCEPAGKLGIDLYRFVVFQILGKFTSTPAES